MLLQNTLLHQYNRVFHRLAAAISAVNVALSSLQQGFKDLTVLQFWLTHHVSPKLIVVTWKRSPSRVPRLQGTEASALCQPLKVQGVGASCYMVR